MNEIKLISDEMLFNILFLLENAFQNRYTAYHILAIGLFRTLLIKIDSLKTRKKARDMYRILFGCLADRS